jgi:hypothetical protein
MLRLMSRFTVIRSLSIALVFFAFGAGRSQAVCPIPDVLVCEEFFRSTNVFIGTVIQARTLPPGAKFFDEWSYELRVQRVFRGPEIKTITVFTENDNGRYPLVKGETYLLFAAPSEERLTINGCGNNRKLSEAQSAIREIHQILKAAESASGGEIKGRLVQGRFIDLGVEGVTISADGGETHLTSVTDKDGWFHFQVPAGKYKVTVKTAKYSIQTYELSFFQPENVEIFNGSCAQLLLFAIPK